MRLEALDERHVEALLAIRRKPEVTRWWGPVDDGFPLSDDPEATRFAILAGDGRVAGLIQYGEEPEPEYRHAWIDIFVDPAHHGTGLAVAALRALIEQLQTERGHHRITIDPALGNERAARAYEKAGFRRAGVHEKAWRDGDGVWHDVQFMELVIAPRA